ncbi:MAG: hypothetical protein ACRD0U_21140 [Acidimicrobiales bacterium]
MSDWQQYDYDKDGALESGRELSDWSANEQAELTQMGQEINQALEEGKQALTGITVDLFYDGTQQGAHYLIQAGEYLIDSAQFVQYAAEVLDWLGTAFRWLGYIVPLADGIADLLEKVEDVTEEKILKAHFVALGIVCDGMLLASAGWTAKLAGEVTDEAWDTAVEVINSAVELGQGITDVLFGD